MTYLPVSMIAALQAAVRDLHPFLDRFYPIGVAADDRLHIYDVDPDRRIYRLVRHSVVPSPVLDGMRATVPLADYGNRPVCVVTADDFESIYGYVGVFHEFVHCAQWETCEPSLAAELATANPTIGNMSLWEARHAFEYEDDRFVYSYGRLLAALSTGDLVTALSCHAAVVRDLAPLDREFMVWQEWKEGFARWVENKVRRRLGLRRNESGRAAPYGRGAFHVGGAGLIDLLVRAEPCLAHQLTDLYQRLHDACGPTACGEAGHRHIYYHPETHATDTGQPVV
jgi:hypothetical protein